MSFNFTFLITLILISTNLSATTVKCDIFSIESASNYTSTSKILQWTSIAAKTPPANKFILARTQGEDIRIADHLYADHTTSAIWRWYTAQFNSNNSKLDITHWLELPEVNSKEWIDVEDQLPLDGQAVALRRAPNENLLIFRQPESTPEFTTAVFEKGLSVAENRKLQYNRPQDQYSENTQPYRWVRMGADSLNGQEATHWMPIPKFEKQLLYFS